MSKKKRSKAFDYVKGINEKNYQGDDLKGYVPYLTNRAFAMHMDTVLLAEEMNQAHLLGPELQYDFYYHAVRKGRRFGFPKKPEATTVPGSSQGVLTDILKRKQKLPCDC